AIELEELREQATAEKCRGSNASQFHTSARFRPAARCPAAVLSIDEEAERQTLDEQVLIGERVEELHVRQDVVDAVARTAHATQKDRGVANLDADGAGDFVRCLQPELSQRRELIVGSRTGSRKCVQMGVLKAGACHEASFRRSDPAAALLIPASGELRPHDIILNSRDDERVIQIAARRAPDKAFIGLEKSHAVHQLELAPFVQLRSSNDAYQLDAVQDNSVSNGKRREVAEYGLRRCQARIEEQHLRTRE